MQKSEPSSSINISLLFAINLYVNHSTQQFCKYVTDSENRVTESRSAAKVKQSWNIYWQELFLHSFGCVGILRLSTEPELKCERKISVLGTGYSITQYKVAQSLNIITMMIQVTIFNKSATLFIQPALRALGLLLADSAPTVGRGKTF